MNVVHTLVELLASFVYDKTYARKESDILTSPIYKKEEQVKYLKDRLELFLEVFDQMEPETTEVEDIDRLIEIVDSIEEKFQSFKNRPDEEPKE